ncbi:hypothetical protein GCM10023319_72980 [Nocardia iowensis]
MQAEAKAALVPADGVPADPPPDDRESGSQPVWSPLHDWRLRTALAGLLVLAMAVILVVGARSFPLRPLVPGENSALAALPPQLSAAASCQRLTDADDADRCVVHAADLLLAGGLTGGRDLTFYVQVSPSDRLAEIIDRWRAAAGAIVSGGPVFVAIGPSNTVWYANTRTGVHLDTGTFASRSSAQTFVARSGLTGGVPW